MISSVSNAGLLNLLATIREDDGLLPTPSILQGTAITMLTLARKTYKNYHWS